MGYEVMVVCVEGEKRLWDPCVRRGRRGCGTPHVCAKLSGSPPAIFPLIPVGMNHTGKVPQVPNSLYCLPPDYQISASLGDVVANYTTLPECSPYRYVWGGCGGGGAFVWGVFVGWVREVVVYIFVCVCV